MTKIAIVQLNGTLVITENDGVQYPHEQLIQELADYEQVFILSNRTAYTYLKLLAAFKEDIMTIEEVIKELEDYDIPLRAVISSMDQDQEELFNYYNEYLQSIENGLLDKLESEQHFNSLEELMQQDFYQEILEQHYQFMLHFFADELFRLEKYSLPMKDVVELKEKTSTKKLIERTIKTFNLEEGTIDYYDASIQNLAIAHHEINLQGSKTKVNCIWVKEDQFEPVNHLEELLIASYFDAKVMRYHVIEKSLVDSYYAILKKTITQEVADQDLLASISVLTRSILIIYYFEMVFLYIDDIHFLRENAAITKSRVLQLLEEDDFEAISKILKKLQEQVIDKVVNDRAPKLVAAGISFDALLKRLLQKCVRYIKKIQQVKTLQKKMGWPVEETNKMLAMMGEWHDVFKSMQSYQDLDEYILDVIHLLLHDENYLERDFLIKLYYLENSYLSFTQKLKVKSNPR